MQNNTIFQESIKSSLKMRNQTMEKVNSGGKRYTFETSSYISSIASNEEVSVLFDCYYGKDKEESNSYSLTLEQVDELIGLLNIAKDKITRQQEVNKILHECLESVKRVDIPAIHIDIVDERPRAYTDVEDSIICTYKVSVKSGYPIDQDDQEFEIYSKIHKDDAIEPFLINIHLSGYIPMDASTLSKLFPTAKSFEYSEKLAAKGQQMIKQKQDDAMKKMKEIGARGFTK